MNKKIFRKYDIRGIFEKDFDLADAYCIAFGLSILANEDNIKKNIFLARDGRLSSKAIRDALIHGFLDAGCSHERIIDIGITSTPALYWNSYNSDDVGIAIMVTGSHNPKEYNGFKIIYNGAYAHGDFFTRLQQCIERQQQKKPKGMHHDVITKSNIIPYIDAVFQYVDQDDMASAEIRDMTVAWDLSNGTMCEFMELFLKRLQGKHYIINGDINGNFPNHEPDPTTFANLQQLSEYIKIRKCDFGVCFDGDGDRLGIMLKGGRVLYGEEMLLLLAYDLLKKQPNSKILVDVRISQFIINILIKLGASVIIWEPGHSKIKNKMQDDGILLGAEMSGHIFFNMGHYISDDALIAAYKIYKLFVNKCEVEKILDSVPVTFKTEEIRIKMHDKLQLLLLYSIQSYLIEHSIKFDCIDGIRVTSKDYYWIVRSANTEDMLVFRIDALNQYEFTKALSIISNALAAVELSLIPIPTNNVT